MKIMRKIVKRTKKKKNKGKNIPNEIYINCSTICFNFTIQELMKTIMLNDSNV